MASSTSADAIVGSSEQDVADLRQRLQRGPLKNGERAQLWPRLLGADQGAAAGKNSIPPALLELLSGDDEEVLFESNEGGATAAANAKQASCLASAFCKRHLRWLAHEQERQLFCAFSQLLMYHFPPVACSLKAVVNVEDGVESVPDMLHGLCSTCGMAVSLDEMLFEVSVGEDSFCKDGADVRDDRSALLLLCDLVAVEGQDLLIPFVVLVLLAETSPEPGCNFTELEDRLRQALTLGGLAMRSHAEVSRCVAEALQLLHATPLSLRCALRAERLGVWYDSPVCMVTPEEVLHHTHGGSSATWRLIVADARMRAREHSLPVCVRIEPARHGSRLQALKDLPGDDALHLCLVGDGPPRRSDEAFELCLGLVGKNSWRKHVSIVDGGWPALEEHARMIGMEMMPIDNEVDDGMAIDAHAVIADVAEQASVAAQMALAEANRALVYFDGRFGAGSSEKQEPQPDANPEPQKTQGQAPRKRRESLTDHANRAFGYLDSMLGGGSEVTESAPQAQATDAGAPGVQTQAPKRKSRIDQSAWSDATNALDYLGGFWGNSAASSQTPEAEEQDPSQQPREHKVGPHFQGEG